MSTDGSFPVNPALAGSTTTLADVLRRFERDRGIDPRRTGEMRSAISTVCRVLGAAPSLVLAEPRQLRPKLAKLTPATAGVSAGRWSNAKSLTLKALKRVGLKSMAGRSREPLSAEWEALRALLPDRHFKSGLYRFMSDCTARGIGPDAVTTDMFIQFGGEVENYSLVRDPGGVYRDTCKLWNLAVRSISGWPQQEVAVPDRRRNFASSLDEFPITFRADVESFLSRSGDADVFSDSYCKPIAPLTVRNRRRGILMAATALVRSGVLIQHVTGLDVLVEFEHAKILLRFLYDRADKKTTDQIYQIANLLKTIAQHYLQQPDATIDKLRRQCKALKPMSERLHREEPPMPASVHGPQETDWLTDVIRAGDCTGGSKPRSLPS
jgi:hypothetical protein